MKFWTGVAATSLFLGAAACGSSFADRDPNGYEACSTFAETDASSDSRVNLGGLLEVGKQARRASTKAIRESAESLFDEDTMASLEGSTGGDDFPIVDAEKLKKACSDEGFEF